ncbi:MAG: response regulator [Ignavibacteriales bacterium]|nr:MAG: response regulator [Ignavibacteriales bacterium]
MKLFKIDKMFSTAGTRSEKGTGMGLILSKEIIDRHSGDIWLYSKQGEGSEFHFTIPCSSNCILIVDENEQDRNFYGEIVKKYFPAFNLVEAQNGFEALELTLSKFPTLILANHSSPLMGGIQLTESVRKTIKNYRLPVIILADKQANEVKEQYSRLGVNYILDKPVSKKILIEKMKAVFEN